MHFNLITIFPEFFDSPLSVGLLGKALDKGVVTVDRVTPRSQTFDRHQTVDDKPYGGGAGLVMMLDPLARTLRSLERPGRILMLSPKGRPLTQAFAAELADEETLTLLCGRYEGIDDRLFDLFPVEPVSVGDVVLNGGETGALCVVEAVSRLLPEFMHKEESHQDESFSDGLLEYPHYTRPEEYEGVKVPEVLFSGHHAQIEAWRRVRSLETTLRARPELLAEAPLTERDVEVLRGFSRERLGRNLYLALVHYPVHNKFGEKVAVSLTNLDIHDMSRVSRSYNAGGLFVVTPLKDQQELAANLLDHWRNGAGSRANPDRAEALGSVWVRSGLEEVVEEIFSQTGQRPRLAATSAKGVGELTPGTVREWLREAPVLLVFGTGHGLAEEVMRLTEGTLRPVRWLDDYNHLSVRSAVSIVVDRILTDVN